MSSFLDYRNEYYIKFNNEKILYRTFIRNCCILFVQCKYNDLREYFKSLGLNFNQDGIIGTIYSDVRKCEDKVHFFMFNQDCTSWMLSSMFRHHIDGTKPLPLYKDPIFYEVLSMPILVILMVWIISLFAN